MNYNRTIVSGYLTRDPQLRHTTKGTPVCNFTIAVNRSWQSSEGERRQEATFVPTVAWNGYAEAIQKHFRKGDPILVEGRLQAADWTTPQGERRSSLQLVVDAFTFVLPKGAARQAGPATAAEPQPATADRDDECPF